MNSVNLQLFKKSNYEIDSPNYVFFIIRFYFQKFKQHNDCDKMYEERILSY